MQNDMLRKDIYRLTAYLLNVCITRLCTLGVSPQGAQARDADVEQVGGQSEDVLSEHVVLHEAAGMNERWWSRWVACG